jgi:hypothetical protein
MCSIVDESRYVVFWHLGQLFLEYAFETGEDDKTLPLVVVVHHSEFDLSIALLDYCWLLWEWYRISGFGNLLLLLWLGGFAL